MRILSAPGIVARLTHPRALPADGFYRETMKNARRWVMGRGGSGELPAWVDHGSDGWSGFVAERSS